MDKHATGNRPVERTPSLFYLFNSGVLQRNIIARNITPLLPYKKLTVVIVLCVIDYNSVLICGIHFYHTDGRPCFHLHDADKAICKSVEQMKNNCSFMYEIFPIINLRIRKRSHFYVWNVPTYHKTETEQELTLLLDNRY